jgi:hypothetical protein
MRRSAPLRLDRSKQLPALLLIRSIDWFGDSTALISHEKEYAIATATAAHTPAANRSNGPRLSPYFNACKPRIASKSAKAANIIGNSMMVFISF